MRRLLLAVCVCACGSSTLVAEAVAGLRWTAPAGWKSEGALPMRVATYTVAPATGDKASAECAVFFFGQGQGGSVEANLDRWKGQFLGPDGKPAVAQIATRTVRGLPVTTIASSGAFTGAGGPMGGASRPLPGYRLLGAIVQGPGGNVFVKFTGPAKTVDANQPKFDQLIASFQPDK